MIFGSYMVSVLNHYLAPEFVRAEGALVTDFLVTTLQLTDASGDTIVNLPSCVTTGAL